MKLMLKWLTAFLTIAFGLFCGCKSLQLVVSEPKPPKANKAKYVLMEKRLVLPVKAFNVLDALGGRACEVRWYHGYADDGHWGMSPVGSRRVIDISAEQYKSFRSRPRGNPLRHYRFSTLGQAVSPKERADVLWGTSWITPAEQVNTTGYPFLDEFKHELQDANQSAEWFYCVTDMDWLGDLLPHGGENSDYNKNALDRLGAIEPFDDKLMSTARMIDPYAMPIQVRLVKRYDYAKFDYFCILSLGALPGYDCRLRGYDVEVHSPIGVRKGYYEVREKEVYGITGLVFAPFFWGFESETYSSGYLHSGKFTEKCSEFDRLGLCRTIAALAAELPYDEFLSMRKAEIAAEEAMRKKEACVAMYDSLASRLRDILAKRNPDNINEAERLAFEIDGDFASRLEAQLGEMIKLRDAASDCDYDTLGERESSVLASVREYEKLCAEASICISKREECRIRAESTVRRLETMANREHWMLVTDEPFRARHAELLQKCTSLANVPSWSELELVDSLAEECGVIEAESQARFDENAAFIAAVDGELEKLDATIAAAEKTLADHIAAGEESIEAKRKEYAGRIACEEGAISRLQAEIANVDASMKLQSEKIEEAQKRTKSYLLALPELSKNSLFAAVAANAEGVEKVFEEIWDSFYDEGCRHRMYEAQLDMRNDGTPNVIVDLNPSGESMLKIKIRTKRNTLEHEAWKRMVYGKLSALNLSSQTSSFEDSKMHRIGGRYYKLGENEERAWQRWKARQSTRYTAELYIVLSLLDEALTPLATLEGKFTPKESSAHALAEWSDGCGSLSVRGSFEYVSGVIDKTVSAQVQVLDAQGMVAKYREILSRQKERKASLENSLDEARKRLSETIASRDADVAELRSKNEDEAKGMRMELESAKAAREAANMRTKSEWRGMFENMEDVK